MISVYSMENEVFIVRSGVAVAVTAGSSGKSLGIYVSEPGFVANVMRLSGTTDRHAVDFNAGHYGFAITDSCGCAISLEVVRNLFRQDSSFAELILAQVVDHYKDALTTMALLKELPGEKRIAWLLSRLEEAGADPSQVTHDTIGKILGMNRVSVTRLMGMALSSDIKG